MAVGYRRIRLEDEILGLAVERANRLPVFDFSHRKSAANLVGCIGEVVFEKFLGYHGIPFRDDRRSTERDYVVCGSLSLDVKTKDRTVFPRGNFDNSVPLYNHAHQRPDLYYFVSLLRNREIDEGDPRRFIDAFLLGGIDRQRLSEVGVTWQAGDVDRSNGTKFWTACINVQMRDLLSNDELLAQFRQAVQDASRVPGRGILPVQGSA